MREKQESIMNENGMVINMNGGQLNFAKDNATINATQNNGVTASELDNIINGIMDNLSGLEKEEADKIVDIVEMVKNELINPEPKVSRLKNGMTLITQMLTIASGFPVLVTNFNNLQDFIMQSIR